MEPYWKTLFNPRTSLRFKVTHAAVKLTSLQITEVVRKCFGVDVLETRRFRDLTGDFYANVGVITLATEKDKNILLEKGEKTIKPIPKWRVLSVPLHRTILFKSFPKSITGTHLNRRVEPTSVDLSGFLFAKTFKKPNTNPPTTTPSQ